MPSVRRFLLASILAAGCGNSGTPAGGDAGALPPDAAAPVPDADPNAPDATPGTMMRLITAPYTIPAGQEFYQCTRITAAEDMYITSITPTAGVGTHHTILAIDPSPEGPGTSTCEALGLNWVVLFASGIGSPSLSMPPGVALPIRAGQEIVFNLHLFNAGDTDISAESALDVTVIPAADVHDMASVILAGNANQITFQIPPGPDQHITGGCTMGADTHFFAVFPHMHRLGTHIKVTATTSPEVVIYDDDYSFMDQRFASFAPIAMPSGSRIEVDCTYNNDTGATVTFGDSTTDEMCFAISYLYPPIPGDLYPGAICSF